jgi:hypothetical protein
MSFLFWVYRRHGLLLFWGIVHSYNIRRRPDVWVVQIAYQRFIAVTVGVLWAAFVSRFWWPAEARRELSKALGEWVTV